MNGKLVYYLTKFNNIKLVGADEMESSKGQHLVIQSGVETWMNSAKIEISEDVVKLTPNLENGTLIYVNGVQAQRTVNIYHNDRIVFGNFQLCFSFLSPYHVSPYGIKKFEPMSFDEIVTELQHSDIDLKILPINAINSKKNMIDRKRLVQMRLTALRHTLLLLEKVENKLLWQYHSNLLKLKLKFREKPRLMEALTSIYVKKNKIDKEIKTLLRDEQKVKKKLQQEIA